MNLKKLFEEEHQVNIKIDRVVKDAELESLKKVDEECKIKASTLVHEIHRKILANKEALANKEYLYQELIHPDNMKHKHDKEFQIKLIKHLCSMLINEGLSAKSSVAYGAFQTIEINWK